MPLIKLTPDQYKTLREALLAGFPGPAKMTDLLRQLNQQYERITVEHYTLEENVAAVIRDAETRDWLPHLVSKARELVPDPAFQRLLQELHPLVPAAAISDFQVTRLTGSYVLIDRAILRAKLEILSQPLGKRILVVTGGDKTGKSYSVQLISYLHLRRSQFKLVPIDLEAYKRLLGPERLIEPIDLAKDLVQKLQYQVEIPDPPSDAQWASWVLDFCNVLEAEALNDPERRWIVIDAFNSVPVTQPTFDLIKELAIRVSTNLTRYRLVLLGYKESFHRVVYPTLAEEQIEAIGKRQLAEFFVQAFEEHGIPLEKPRLTAAVRRVLQGLDPKDADFLTTLGQRAGEELERAASVGGGR
ncbi:hypothetical protein SAMN05660209_05021 [Geodermatophilus africanus]|uniref:Effector-associated domain-containing protein n=1 Tax=Geodermatophilus africanus TaxID=1137993 RepID=A0A1H3R3M9_9ACTN|nr:effector-associated domain EAD1-containing protein [Geodermatophilus africanus]SDZ20432.1 hypothetical protein SAMN05660209_05021 [Geodermatophilus africanus]